MRAVTIRANEVIGVAGFVLPGDRVDVLLTRSENRSAPTTEILLQNLRVLGIDQQSSEKQDKPTVARAVTLEVTEDQAEKLTLASTVGTLSLILRNSANMEPVAVGPVGLTDLSPTAAAKPDTPQAESAQTASVRILRGTAATDYEVGIGGAVHGPGPRS
jgi:pilus assembly protein CpaB